MTRASLRRWATITLLVVALAAVGAWLIVHALAVLRLRGVQAGFDFLWQPAGFQLGEGWFGDDSTQPMWLAFAAGLVNTLRVALPAIVLATLLGTLIGLGRRAHEPVLRGLCSLYVESLRNVPLLVHLLLGYFALTHLLPPATEPWTLAHGVYLSKSGLAVPWWTSDGGIEWPRLESFGPVGGMQWTPEYLALLMGLTGYTAAFIAEIVRAGVQAVPLAQKQAALALGLSRAQQLRHVVLPQALRLIVPALGNQWLNLTKNASLGVAIGYPELVSVSNTALNQTGRAFECITVLMAVYLSLSLLITGLLNTKNGVRPQ